MKKPKGSTTKISPKTKQKTTIRLIVVGAGMIALTAIIIICINFFRTRDSKASATANFNYRSTDINVPVMMIRDQNSMNRTRDNNFKENPGKPHAHVSRATDIVIFDGK